MRGEVRRIVLSRTFDKAYQCSALLHDLLRDDRNQKYRTGKEDVAMPGRSKSGPDLGMTLAAAVQLARLRNLLSDYYAGEGYANPLRILVADEGYRVDIEVAPAHSAETPWLF